MVTGKVDEARAMALEAGFSEIHMQLGLELPGIGLVQLAHFPYEPDDLTVLPDFELRYLEHHPRSERKSFCSMGMCIPNGERAYPSKPWMMNVGVIYGGCVRCRRSWLWNFCNTTWKAARSLD